LKSRQSMAEQPHFQGEPPKVRDDTAESSRTGELAINTDIVITGLVGAKELNGQVGTIKNYDPSTGRYGVVTSSNSEKGFNIKRANLISLADHAEQQDTEYNNRRTAAMASSLGHPCPICLDDMSDDGGGRALVCGHRVHRLCWDALLSAKNKEEERSGLPNAAHCPVCRAWQGGECRARTKRWYELTAAQLVTGLLGFIFQSRSVEETGFDAAMEHEAAFVQRRFKLVELAGQKDDAESALNLVLGEIKVAVYAMVARGEKPTQKGLVCEDRTRWREAFTTWLMVYVLPCYPERVGLPEGPNDPVDQVWLPYMMRWINSGGLKVIYDYSEEEAAAEEAKKMGNQGTASKP